MSFRRYPRYRASGAQWLGEIPAHWRVTPLKHLVRLRSGGTPSKERTEYWHGAVPWASAKDLKVEHLADTQDHITQLAIDQRAADLVPAGSLLVVVRGMILAHTFPVAKALVPMAINQDLKAVLPTSALDGDFVAWLLRGAASETLARLDDAAHGTKALRLEAWGSLALPVPPLLEQVAIASFLSAETATIDALVAEQMRLIDRLKEKRQAVISHAVTKGLNPDAPMKPSGVEWLGDVPAHWGVARIATLFREVVEPGAEELPILSVSIHDGVSDDELNEHELDRKVTRSSDRAKYKRVTPGDLVYNMMRAWQGGFGAVTVAGMVSPAYVVARPRSGLRAAYVEQVLRTGCAVEEMRRRSQGVTDFRLRLYWDEFKDLRIPVPPAEEMDLVCGKIAEVSDAYDLITARTEECIRLLAERRTALITAAVTGQIDVRGLASEVA